MVTDVTYENIIAISAISKLYLVPLLGLTSCHFLCIICGFCHCMYTFEVADS